MFIGMDPPKHDRLKALFQRGFARTATRDTELRGQSIREGEKLVIGTRPPTATSPATRTPNASTSGATPSTRS